MSTTMASTIWNPSRSYACTDGLALFTVSHRCVAPRCEHATFRRKLHRMRPARSWMRAVEVAALCIRIKAARSDPGSLSRRGALELFANRRLHLIAARLAAMQLTERRGDDPALA